MRLDIHKMRIKRGLTQWQLADKIGVRTSTISQWEGGTRSPSAKLLPALAAALGCSIDELFAEPGTAEESAG